MVVESMQKLTKTDKSTEAQAENDTASSSADATSPPDSPTSILRRRKKTGDAAPPEQKEEKRVRFSEPELNREKHERGQ